MESIEALLASIKIWQTLHSASASVLRNAELRSAKGRDGLGRKDTGKAAA
jgi:hypothetical protein